MADTTPGQAYIVQPGNNLWQISRRAYGAGTRYLIIYSANLGQIRDPQRIYPGQMFKCRHPEIARLRSAVLVAFSPGPLARQFDKFRPLFGRQCCQERKGRCSQFAPKDAPLSPAWRTAA